MKAPVNQEWFKSFKSSCYIQFFELRLSKKLFDYLNEKIIIIKIIEEKIIFIGSLPSKNKYVNKCN